MGQKVNPVGIRLGINKKHTSTWYASSRFYSKYLIADSRARDYLFSKLKGASVGRIEVERPAGNAKITIRSARPGVVIGRKGEDVERLRADVALSIGVPVQINIEEIKRPELDARLVSESVASQLEKRVMFRRAMKKAVQSALKAGALGIKISVSGRLAGAEIARTEWYREGRVPLHTFRADIDYCSSRAETTYGTIGVKVWIFKGEVLSSKGRSSPDDQAAQRRKV